jgi:uncharacterized repeat protein (TIGR03803 family)
MWITPLTDRVTGFAIAAIAMALAATAVNAQGQGATYEVVSTFDVETGAPTSVIQTRDGQFYGTSAGGPAHPPLLPGQTGTVFTMDATGARTIVKVLRTQGAISPTDGTPLTALFEGADGTLYGTTYARYDSFLYPGQIFQISPATLFTTLVTSYQLQAGVIQARDGRLYGTSEGIVFDPTPTTWTYGTVFRLEADNTFTVLHRFTGADSANPVAELVEIDDGSLYGTTRGGSFYVPPSGVSQSLGAVFRVDPTNGDFAIRHQFSGSDGSKPLGRLIQGNDGLIYGTTSEGGTFGFGTVFSLDAAGTLTTLHHFTGDDGANPHAGVIQAFDGRLYGTTRNRGAFGYGTVFAIEVTGRLTTLHDFSLTDGGNPATELIQANDGDIYGAAPAGGTNDRGVIFRVRLEGSPQPDQYVEIVSRNSGKCLDVFGASTDAGASAIQWTCHGGTNQQWRLEQAGGGAVRIIARHSGLALDVFGASLDDVAPVIQWPVHGGDNQAWTLEPAGDGYVRLVVRDSGKAMDVEFASTDDGARVIQYTPHNGANQQWLLRAVTGPSGAASQ